MDHQERHKSMLSQENTMNIEKKKMWEVDKAMEPGGEFKGTSQTLSSTTETHLMGISYPPGCPITTGPPMKVQQGAGAGER